MYAISATMVVRNVQERESRSFCGDGDPGGSEGKCRVHQDG